MDQPSDIRNLSAHRPVSAPVVELRSPAQLRPDLRDAIEPARRRFGRPQQVIREHTNNAVRWKVGERLNHVLEEACIRFSENDAVITEAGTLSYRELDCRANQVARYLIEQGVQPGDRVGLLFEKCAETYIAMLAVMKVNAAYVPLDAAFPLERLRFIMGDAEIKTIVSMSNFTERLAPLDVQKVFLDSAKRAIDKQDASRLAGVARSHDPVCYIIYTSGTTGNPKGVAIAQPSICNFVRVAAELYGYQPGDRIYQGMTIAFDFSIEEIWVPLVAGATLVPARAGLPLMGDELADFLRERDVTVMACCPTLLATIEQDLPKLRLLLVGGEACPQNLVARWYRPNRRILNSYGPTEATVTATLTELRPDKPVTIGVPLSTYSIVILDPNEDKTVENGELGEIGIAGVGLALGYMNRDELTMKKFIRDFLNIQNNPSGRIYRTGDLGRIDENGEIEYRGRIDTQVKIRGYRIELNEIEAVLLDLPQIAQAAVTTFEPEPDVVELVAYYALKQGAELPRDEISQALRSKLPAYMVPAFLEELPAIPMTLSNKADHKRLPKPQLGRFSSAATGYVAPKTENERILHSALCEVLRVDRVSTEHHFFDDLGANSLLMARVCATIRKNPRMANVSMRDIYTNPTIARLAEHLDKVIGGVVATKREPFHVPSNLAYYTCGAMQAVFYAAYALFGLWVLDTGYEWTVAASGAVELYIRARILRGRFVRHTHRYLDRRQVAADRPVQGRHDPDLELCLFPLLGRQDHDAHLAGDGLHRHADLQRLSAPDGREDRPQGAVMSCRYGPVCADLLSIGDNTILRKDTIVLGYRAQSNFIHIGPVEIGANAFVGEASVIDIDTTMGDDTQLGHASSLQSGQHVPDGKHYHGSPAVETTSDYCPIESQRGRHVPQRSFYTALELAALFLVAVPAPIVAYHVWDQYSPDRRREHWRRRIGTVAARHFGGAVLRLDRRRRSPSVYVIPRLCMLFLKPGVTYPTFGFHYLMQSIILRISNSEFFCVLFGDCSFITTYMR